MIQGIYSRMKGFLGTPKPKILNPKSYTRRNEEPGDNSRKSAGSFQTCSETAKAGSIQVQEVLGVLSVGFRLFFWGGWVPRLRLPLRGELVVT